LNRLKPITTPPPSFVEMFTPKLVTVLREGYRLSDLRADALAALTVAIVALPLSMAIAIASGVSPERGLYTAIVGGFLVSALGGSRFQIGGPAGAFIVLVAATVARHGTEGLFLATFLAGIILLAIGLLRLGTYIRFIPFPVTVGFTAGIAVIIFASQIKDLLGLTLSAPEPGALGPKLIALSAALPSMNSGAVGLTLITIGTILAVRQLKPNWPALLIAVTLATLIAAIGHVPVETIGTRFGGIPRTLPAPALPALSIDKIMAVAPDAVSFALLGAIESLLSAVVADGMTGRRHRSNCELVAQGIANMASACFGGVCATGTIARTATNVGAAAKSPISGMLHSLILLAFMLVAAPLASFIPLAALAGVLATVAWSMAERHAFGSLLRASWGDAAVLLSTFLLTIFVGLTEGIVVGFSLGALIFLNRMAQTISVETQAPLVPQDQADKLFENEPSQAVAAAHDTIVYRIRGAFFFGSAASVGTLLDRVPARAKTFVLDFSTVPLVDSTGTQLLKSFARTVTGRGAQLFITATSPEVRRALSANGLKPPLVRYSASIEAALAASEFVPVSKG
jgi:SulP family sulfate permease